jgi:16S rRNA (adenine1518-N6/adenine1519-N6)-dimethyltransferase
MPKKSSPVRLSNGKPHQARKRFGQNFLHDQQVIQRIVDAINPSVSDRLLEIGPGQGAITDYLAESGASLDCVELDRDLAAFLEKRFANSDNLTIHQHDILKFDLATLSRSDSEPGAGGEEKRLRVIGNLPYNISTPVMFHLLQSHELIEDMTFMLQLEVVQRLGAQPGNKNYGRLGLMVQYFCEVKHLFNVPSAAFTPQPKVSSAIVRLKPHRQRAVTARSVAALQTVIRTAFNQRRKTLKNSLKAILSSKSLAQVPVNLSERPENLSLADYVVISDILTQELNEKKS